MTELCEEVVRRLLAGGISETAIRNTLVHHRPSCDHWSCGGNPCLIGKDVEEIAADEQRQGCTIVDDHMR